MEQFFSSVFYIIVAILALLFMITVHELGHYAAGKFLNFKINEFAIGFGKPLFKRTSKKSGEVFSLRLIPLGGFCAFEGEDEDKENPQAFNNQKPWKRIIVLLSGVAANFLFSLILCMIIFFAAGMFFPKVSLVYDDYDTNISQEYKLKEGDIILAVEGKFLYLRYDLQDAIENQPLGERINITVVREGQRQNVSVVKRNYAFKDDKGETHSLTGLGISSVSETYRLGFFETIAKAVGYCFRMAGVILSFFGQLITGKISLSSIGGPITTIGFTAQTASKGLLPLLEIVTLIGVNLAVFNVLPIPALDGSRIMFVAIEALRGKPVKREIEGKIHFVGLLVLFGFVILVDLMQLFQHF